MSKQRASILGATSSDEVFGPCDSKQDTIEDEEPSESAEKLIEVVIDHDRWYTGARDKSFAL